MSSKKFEKTQKNRKKNFRNFSNFFFIFFKKTNFSPSKFFFSVPKSFTPQKNFFQSLINKMQSNYQGDRRVVGRSIYPSVTCLTLVRSPPPNLGFLENFIPPLKWGDDTMLSLLRLLTTLIYCPFSVLQFLRATFCCIKASLSLRIGQ